MAQTTPDDATVPSTPDRRLLQLEYDQKLRESVAAFNVHRSVIEQAKGMLMFIYGIDADEAFNVLSWQSQATNVKLRLLSERLVRDFVALSPGERVPDQSACNAVLFKDSPNDPTLRRPA